MWIIGLYLLVLALYFGSNEEATHRNLNKSLLVIAHPDDEVMFFGPTLNHFRRRNDDELHVLCMSNGEWLPSPISTAQTPPGNADGLGTLRQQELYDSLSVFGIQQDKITVVDDV